MFGLLVFIVLWVVVYRVFFRKKKAKKPVESFDLSKNSDYYLRKYPDILGKPRKEEPKVTINVNITHNHLHVYPKDEGK